MEPLHITGDMPLEGPPMREMTEFTRVSGAGNPPEPTLAFTPGEGVLVNGLPARVLNVARQSLTVRLEKPIRCILKGEVFEVYRLIGERDLVLRPVQKVEIKQWPVKCRVCKCRLEEDGRCPECGA